MTVVIRRLYYGRYCVAVAKCSAAAVRQYGWLS